MSTIVTRTSKGLPLTWAEADANFTNLDNDKAELASPTFIGTPAAPTATVGTNTTQIATTAFVNSEISNDAILKSGGTATGQIKGITPVAAEDLTRKDYVDTMLPKAGGTMTGPLKNIQPFGYALGGGSVTQSTDKTTAVALNKSSGVITTLSSALSSGAIARFPLSNSFLLSTDILLVQRKSGGTGSAYRIWTDYCIDYEAGICIQNITTGSLSEAVVISFAIINGAGA